MLPRRILILAAWLCCGSLARGQAEPAPVVEPAPPAAIDEVAASEWITSVVRGLLPAEYENTREWGKTKRMFDGLKVHRDGLQLKTKRRWKEANHGTWKSYRVRPLDPQQAFQLTVQNIARKEDGSVTFDLLADTRLTLEGRISEWQWDVQLFSLSAEGSARVVLTARCELAMRLDPRKLPPDLVLAPKVLAADVGVYEFHIDRISKLDGPVAEEIGRGMRRALEEKLEEDRPKLAEKLNRQIAKNQDKLRLSLFDALSSKWGQWIDADSLQPAPAEVAP